MWKTGKRINIYGNRNTINYLQKRQDYLFKNYGDYPPVVKSNIIGRMVMDGLKEIDKIAYIRFASVYTNFKEVEEFGQIVDKLDVNKSE